MLEVRVGSHHLLGRHQKMQKNLAVMKKESPLFRETEKKKIQKAILNLFTVHKLTPKLILRNPFYRGVTSIFAFLMVVLIIHSPCRLMTVNTQHYLKMGAQQQNASLPSHKCLMQKVLRQLKNTLKALGFETSR